MAIFDGIFQRYRNGNRGVRVQHGIQQPEPSDGGRFGQEAL